MRKLFSEQINMKILLKSFVDFYRDDGPMFAGAISCFFMMAFIPFFLFLVSIFGYVLGQHNHFHNFFLSQVIHLFPKVTHQITQQLQSIILYRDIGIVTLFIYGLFSYQLYVSLETAVHHIFKMKAKRSLVFSLLLSLLIVPFLMWLFYSSSIFLIGAELVHHLGNSKRS